MHRLTARLLLLVMLVGTLAPISMALSQESSHACCLRKQPHQHSSRELSFDSRHCNHDCCRSLAQSQWAQPRPPVMPRVADKAASLATGAASSDHNFILRSPRSVRAPPAATVLA